MLIILVWHNSYETAKISFHIYHSVNVKLLD
jgi:hypothetical protein